MGLDASFHKHVAKAFKPPEKSSAEVAADRKRLQQEVVACIEGEIPPVEATTAYAWGLAYALCTALMMIVAYVAIIVAVWYGVFSFIFRGSSLMRGGGIWMAALYVVNLVCGPVLLFLMVKRMFQTSGRYLRPREVDEEKEPILFKYVTRVCEAVRAPIPDTIRVDCQVNASASIERHWFERRLCLTIGLPLAAGLTLRQFTGVLAHEFGHFSQRGGMTISNFVRRVNYWMYRMAYEPDSLDDWLKRKTRRGAGMISLFAWPLRGGVWLNRLILKGLFFAGAAVAGFVVREMEYDADRYETRMVGCETFESTCRRIGELTVAHQWALNDLGTFLDEERLADDFAALVLANIPHIKDEQRKKLRELAEEAETSVFDTHPTDRDRIASSREEDTQGLFDSPFLEKLSASVLFTKFEPLSKKLTRDYYEELFDKPVPKEFLHPVKFLVERQQAEMEAFKSLKRYFQVRIPLFHPLPLDEDAGHPPDDPAQAEREVHRARDMMLEELKVYKRFIERHDESEQRFLQLVRAQAVLNVGLSFHPPDYGLSRGSEDEVRKELEIVREELRKISGKLLPFEKAAGKRLTRALQLLAKREVYSRIENGKLLRNQIQVYVPEARFVSELLSNVLPIRQAYCALDELLGAAEGNREFPPLFEGIYRRMQAIRRNLENLADQMGDHAYPFVHNREDMTLREFTIPHIPADDDLGGCGRATEMMLDRLVMVQVRLFAKLAQAAERVETVLGLELLPDPKEEDKPEKRGKGREDDDDYDDYDDE